MNVWRSNSAAAAIFYCVVAFFLSASGTSLAQSATSQVTIDQRPQWVEAEEPPPFREKDAEFSQDGVFYRLYDRQAKVEGARYQSYLRIIKRVTSGAGLGDAGRIELKFDPSQEQLVLHAIRVRRGGETTNRLKPEAFTIVRREEGLEQGVTDGQLTAFVELADIRVGDEVDYEASWIVRSPLWPGDYFDEISLQWSVPVDLAQQRVITDKPLMLAPRGQPVDPVIDASGGFTTYSWRQVRPAIVHGEDRVPASFAFWSGVSVSTLKSWREVADSLAPHYDRAAAFPDALSGKFDGGDLNRQITQAVRYVQDDIRYVADEVGVGSHLPRSAATIVDRGWGDCKDKSVLLVALLRRLGVEAFVALTDNDSGSALSQRAPSPFAFDHAIVVAVVDGERRWIDATWSHQGGIFPAIEPPVVSYALPLRTGADALWPVAAASPKTPDRVITETFDFAGHEKTGFSINVETALSGLAADNMRRTLAGKSRSELAKGYLEYYAKLYPGLASTSELAVTDDRDANKILVNEAYRLNADKFESGGLLDEFRLEADAVNNVVDSIVRDGRSAPVSLSFPFHSQHVVELQNTGVEMSGIEAAALKTPAFEFERISEPQGDSVRISWRLQTLKPEVSVEALDDYVRLTTEITDWNSVTYDLSADAAAEDLTAFEILGVAMLAGLVIFLPLTLWGAWASVKADAATIDRSVLYPLSAAKFMILGFLSFGLYGVFWTYRCWRQEKRASNSEISPFARAFFSVIFFYPLFAEIRERFDGGARKPPVLIGVGLAFGYLALSIISAVMSRAAETSDNIGLGAISLVNALIVLVMLPLALMVNRLNAGSPDIIAAHSRWTWRSLVLAGLGLMTWGLSAYGLLADS